MTRNKNLILLTLVVVVCECRKFWNIKKRNFATLIDFSVLDYLIQLVRNYMQNLELQSFLRGRQENLFWTSANVFSWFQSQGGCPHLCASLPVCNIILSQIHLWCETCWPPSSKHGSRAMLIHILVNKHWVGWRTGSIALLPQCETRQILYRLSYAGSTYISINGTHFPPDLIHSKCQSDLLTLIAMLSNE